RFGVGVQSLGVSGHHHQVVPLGGEFATETIADAGGRSGYQRPTRHD
ncbi:MAG: hypothetical protein RLZZ626_733, partial [Actinomycetota bacterium]